MGAEFSIKLRCYVWGQNLNNLDVGARNFGSQAGCKAMKGGIRSAVDGKLGQRDKTEAEVRRAWWKQQ